MIVLAAHIGAALCLVFIAAVLGAGQTALKAASRPRVGELARRGRRRAVMALDLMNASERARGALLLGRIATGVAATVTLMSALFNVSGNWGAVAAAAVMILVLALFAEAMPRAIAKAHPDRVALSLAPALRIFVALLAPLMDAIAWAVKHLLRLLGFPAGKDQPGNEVNGAGGLSPKQASEVKNVRDMLGGLLDLDTLEVSDIMVHRTRMTMIDASEPVGEIVELLLKSGRTRIPVWRDKPDNIIGVLHAKNLFAALQKAGGDAAKVDLEDILSPPWFVPDTRPITDQLNAFLRRKTHFAIVVDEYGEVQGLVTLEDIIEEIVGDIRDEHDAVAAGARRRPDGSFVIEGGVPVRDLNRAFDWQLPDEEATTLAGLVIHEARMIPEAGQTFNFHGFQFEILKKRKQQLTSLKVTPLGQG